MNTVLLLLFIAAPQKATPEIILTTKACLPLLEAQATQLKDAYAHGLDAIKQAEGDRRNDAIARTDQLHQQELAALKAEHTAQMAAKKSHWLTTLATCMQAINTNRDYGYVHEYDSARANDIYVMQAVACGPLAIIKFQIRQLLAGKPFGLREILIAGHDGGEATYDATWTEPGVFAGIAVLELASSRQEQVDIVFRGVDAVKIDEVELVQ